MKKKVMMLVLATIAFAPAWSQSSDDERAVKEAVSHFAQSADRQDAGALDKLLDANFRVIMNRLFGSTEVNVLTKDEYLEKIRAKEFGGETRKVRIEDVTIIGNTACAKVAFRGSQTSFTSFLQFVKTEDAHWRLVSDMPTLM